MSLVELFKLIPYFLAKGIALFSILFEYLKLDWSSLFYFALSFIFDSVLYWRLFEIIHSFINLDLIINGIRIDRIHMIFLNKSNASLVGYQRTIIV